MESWHYLVFSIASESRSNRLQQCLEDFVGTVKDSRGRSTITFVSTDWSTLLTDRQRDAAEAQERALISSLASDGVAFTRFEAGQGNGLGTLEVNKDQERHSTSTPNRSTRYPVDFDESAATLEFNIEHIVDHPSSHLRVPSTDQPAIPRVRSAGPTDSSHALDPPSTITQDPGMRRSASTKPVGSDPLTGVPSESRFSNPEITQSPNPSHPRSRLGRGRASVTVNKAVISTQDAHTSSLPQHQGPPISKSFAQASRSRLSDPITVQNLDYSSPKSRLRGSAGVTILNQEEAKRNADSSIRVSVKGQAERLVSAQPE